MDLRGLILGRWGRKLRGDFQARRLLLFFGRCIMSLSAPEVLNREFLEIRCKILDLAAAFDRLGRADGSVEGDQRIARLREALQTVLDEPQDRAEQVQMIFSRPYEEGWQEELKVKPR